MIEVNDLTVSVEDRTILDDVSFTVAPGEFVLLVGHNGAGKTTLLDHLSGLDQPQSGSVHVDKIDVYDRPTDARARVGRVFENPGDQLLGATVGADVAFGPENLGLDHHEIQRRVSAALDVVGLTESSAQSVDALSGGEQARLAIAGALAMQPAYLLLDEPTAGLDHPGRQRIIEHLRQVRRNGIGILLATHDLRDLRTVVDRLIGLRNGALVLNAPPEDTTSSLDEIGVRMPTGWTDT